MNKQYLISTKRRSVVNIATACFLILINCGGLFAQYKGAPVKKERLIKSLRSRQFQTRDIVTIIGSNGVDFKLTAEIKNSLIAAGARPEVIQAVVNNPRVSAENNNLSAKSEKRVIIRRSKPVAPNYDDLLEQALSSFKDQQNSVNAIRFLKTAAKLNPRDPAAYQMMGFINLYGLNNLPEAQKYMRAAILNGGSAVFRVFHDDNGNFMRRCTGSLYISPESIRFESDDNIHTFETSTVNVDKIKLDRESSKIWKNHTIFKVFLKIGKDKAKFSFAPITGKEEESKMVAQFVQESRSDGNFTGVAMNILK